MSDMISPYISVAEYCCRHCYKLPPDLKKDEDGEWPTFFEALFGRFKTIRELWGKPINITSGYRCLVHNKELGGELGSVHCFGGALDCAVGINEVDKFAGIIEDMFEELRMGKYYADGFVHLDIGFLIYPRMSEAWVEGMRWTK